MHFINMRIYLRAAHTSQSDDMLTLQGFLIFTHVGKVRLRKGFEVRQLFPPSLDFVASLLEIHRLAHFDCTRASAEG
jgi:hypothetical protein